MISGQLLDTVILGYVSYAAFVGLRYGLFHVLVSIFGIYGAWLFAWLFRQKAYTFISGFISIPFDESSIYFFLMLWVLFYIMTYFFAKLATLFFKLTGINFILRISGAVLNVLKAVLIVTVVLTFISSLKADLFESTPITKRITTFGYKVMTMYKNSADEHQVDLKKIKEIKQEPYIMDDDFRYNLLER